MACAFCCVCIHLFSIGLDPLLFNSNKPRLNPKEKRNGQKKIKEKESGTRQLSLISNGRWSRRELPFILFTVLWMRRHSNRITNGTQRRQNDVNSVGLPFLMISDVISLMINTCLIGFHQTKLKRITKLIKWQFNHRCNRLVENYTSVILVARQVAAGWKHWMFTFESHMSTTIPETTILSH